VFEIKIVGKGALLMHIDNFSHKS